MRAHSLDLLSSSADAFIDHSKKTGGCGSRSLVSRSDVSPVSNGWVSSLLASSEFTPPRIFGTNSVISRCRSSVDFSSSSMCSLRLTAGTASLRQALDRAHFVFDRHSVLCLCALLQDSLYHSQSIWHWRFADELALPGSSRGQRFRAQSSRFVVFSSNFSTRH